MTTTQNGRMIPLQLCCSVKMDDKIYIPVANVKFADLYDWGSGSTQKVEQQTTFISRRGLLRQNSQTGSVVDCNEEKIALFRHNNDVFAIQERCPHAGGPLHLGDIEDLHDGSLCVRCPWHSWRIDLRSGKVRVPKKSITTSVYPVKVKSDGTLLIGFDKFAAIYFSTCQDF